MKKVIHIIFLILITHQHSLAQNSNEDRIDEVRYEIITKLNAITKANGYGDRGRDKLTYWNYVKDIPNNHALFEFTYLGKPDGGVYENDYRYRIDMARVTGVKMGKSNAGQPGLFFFADGEPAIQEYIENHDWTVGDVKYRQDDWEKQASIFMDEDEELFDLFSEFIKLTNADRKINPTNYSKLNEPDIFNNVSYEKPLSEEAQATLDAFDAISVLLGNYWELSGSISTFTYEIGPSGYNPIKKYDPTDARFTIVYGEKKLTFNLGMGLTWIDLPSYRKYNTSGTELKYTDYGTVRYLSPSAGLTYKFMSKENKEDFFRDFEFPLTVSFAPLFSPKSDDVSIKSQAFDTPFDKYFDGLSFNINASLGANIYFGKGIGLGLSGGVTYVNINGTTTKLTETDSNNRQNDFTIKFDKLSRIVPRVELKLILRN